MYYGNIKLIDIADGDGVRVSLFVSGCRNHCKGCFSEQTWEFQFYGSSQSKITRHNLSTFRLWNVVEQCKKSYISGLTILGGDPFEQENQLVLLSFIKKFKLNCPDKTLWMYTGYILDKDLKYGQRKYIHGVTNEIIDCVDVLVDCPFIESKKDLNLKFRGSSNQRILTKDQIKELYK